MEMLEVVVAMNPQGDQGQSVKTPRRWLYTKLSSFPWCVPFEMVFQETLFFV